MKFVQIDSEWFQWQISTSVISARAASVFSQLPNTIQSHHHKNLSNIDFCLIVCVNDFEQVLCLIIDVWHVCIHLVRTQNFPKS